eukprot:3448011-Rhodomonas_salina.1
MTAASSNGCEAGAAKRISLQSARSGSERRLCSASAQLRSCLRRWAHRLNDFGSESQKSQSLSPSPGRTVPSQSHRKPSVRLAVRSESRLRADPASGPEAPLERGVGGLPQAQAPSH